MNLTVLVLAAALLGCAPSAKERPVPGGETAARDWIRDTDFTGVILLGDTLQVAGDALHVTGLYSRSLTEDHETAFFQEARFLALGQDAEAGFAAMVFPAAKTPERNPPPESDPGPGRVVSRFEARIPVPSQTPSGRYLGYVVHHDIVSSPLDFKLLRESEADTQAKLPWTVRNEGPEVSADGLTLRVDPEHGRVECGYRLQGRAPLQLVTEDGRWLTLVIPEAGEGKDVSGSLIIDVGGEPPRLGTWIYAFHPDADPVAARWVQTDR